MFVVRCGLLLCLDGARNPCGVPLRGRKIFFGRGECLHIVRLGSIHVFGCKIELRLMWFGNLSDSHGFDGLHVLQ